MYFNNHLITITYQFHLKYIHLLIIDYRFESTIEGFI